MRMFFGKLRLMCALVGITMTSYVAYGQGGTKLSSFPIASVATNSMTVVVVVNTGTGYTDYQLTMAGLKTYIQNGTVGTITGGYGVNVTGTTNVTVVADTGTIFPKYATTIVGGYGIIYGTRYYKVDTATLYTKYASTVGAGFGILYGTRYFAVDTASVYHALESYIWNDITITSGGKASIKSSVVLMGAPSVSGTPSNSAGGLLTTDGAQTLTNKRWTPRVETAASYTTSHTVNSDNYDLCQITAQAGPLLFNAPTGTPVAGQLLEFQVRDNNTARALTWNSAFQPSSTVSLPTTTVIGKPLWVEFQWDSINSYWIVQGVNQN